jgi:hypothetical protein
VVLGLTLLGVFGCARTPSFELERPPSRFTEVVSSVARDGATQLWMEGPSGVELHITTQDNYWPDTLASLDERALPPEHLLHRQQAVESANGVPGTRFDTSYRLRNETKQLMSATRIVFFTDEWEVVVEFRGEYGSLADFEQDIEQVVAAIEIHGCKPRKRACESAQPQPLALADPPAPDDEDASASDDALASNEALCVHAHELLRGTIEGEAPEFMAECGASLAHRKAQLGPEAAAELVQCVQQADSLAALTRCGAATVPSAHVYPSMPCVRVVELFWQSWPADQPGPETEQRVAVHRECVDGLDAARERLSPLAFDVMVGCIMEASSFEELERCKY